jgi:hypothetical protein
MLKTEQTSKRRPRRKALPALGAAGLLSLAGASASALTVGHAGNMPTSSTDPSHEITLSEEEVSDVTLATFYVFDKENTALASPSVRLVRGGGGCGHGCGGCGRGCGIGGGCRVGGCGFGCRSFGGCRCGGCVIGCAGCVACGGCVASGPPPSPSDEELRERGIPTWCRSLRRPNSSVCGSVHREY